MKIIYKNFFKLVFVLYTTKESNILRFVSLLN